jgi:hypothetical protein
MTQETADWINRIGMAIGFLSFWFAAPEFIGEERLKEWEDRLARILRALPKHSVLYWIAVYAVVAAICFLYIALWTHWLLPSVPHPVSWLLRLTCLIVGGIIINKKIMIDLLQRVVGRLATRGRERQRLLFIGGVLFTCSFALQLTATFPTKPSSVVDHNPGANLNTSDPLIPQSPKHDR